MVFPRLCAIDGRFEHCVKMADYTFIHSLNSIIRKGCRMFVHKVHSFCFHSVVELACKTTNNSSVLRAIVKGFTFINCMPEGACHTYSHSLKHGEVLKI